MPLDQPAAGLRRITPPMLETMRAADAFAGLINRSPGQVLAAFKAAAPFLGIGPRVVHVVDWLFKFSRSFDWEPGSRPIVWPSAAEQQSVLELGPAQVKQVNRRLAELGLVLMRDSPNGKRFGRRVNGRIVEAYGFDLSPLATRMAEFEAIAAEGRARKERMQTLRRRATTARNRLRQTLAATVATARPASFDPEVWRLRAAALGRGIRDICEEGVLVMAVAGLERVLAEAQAALQQCIATPTASTDPVETSPEGLENQPHITATNEALNPTDTVVARETLASEPGSDLDSRFAASRGQRVRQAARADERDALTKRYGDSTSDELELKVAPAELMHLAPRLRRHLPRSPAGWHDIVDAADGLRGELGISRSLWGEACLALGRPQAAVAVAIIAEKGERHFRVGPGAYFSGMLRRAKTGELHLGRSLWGLRKRTSDGAAYESE
jgi:replication initiation protein RepC